jgi:hypothetical protein
MSRRPRVAEFPCGVCNRECGVNTILCGTCDKWHHRQCEHITAAEFKKLSGTSVDYVCAKCRCDGDKFDYSKGLRRLAVFIGNKGDLEKAAETETVYMKKHPAAVSNDFKYQN